MRRFFTIKLPPLLAVVGHPSRCPPEASMDSANPPQVVRVSAQHVHQPQSSGTLGAASAHGVVPRAGGGGEPAAAGNSMDHVPHRPSISILPNSGAGALRSRTCFLLRRAAVRHPVPPLHARCLACHRTRIAHASTSSTARAVQTIR